MFKGSRQCTWEWGLRLSFWPHMCMHIHIHMHTCTSYYTFLWQIIHIFTIVSPYEKNKQIIISVGFRDLVASQAGSEKQRRKGGGNHWDQLWSIRHSRCRVGEMAQQWRARSSPAEFPEPMSDTSQLPLIPAWGGSGGCLAPSSGVRDHLHSQRIPTQRHKIKNKKNLLKIRYLKYF